MDHYVVGIKTFLAVTRRKMYTYICVISLSLSCICVSVSSVYEAQYLQAFPSHRDLLTVQKIV